MTRLNRRPAPESAAVDPTAEPGSYLMRGDGSFVRTDEAPGAAEPTRVEIPPSSAQAMAEAFARLGVEIPDHLAEAASDAAPASEAATVPMPATAPADTDA